MKQLTYPNRVAIPVDKDHGKMLEQLARDTNRTRPGVFLEALRLFFERSCDYKQKQTRGAR
jgi:predicted transcriptional regulator